MQHDPGVLAVRLVVAVQDAGMEQPWRAGCGHERAEFVEEVRDAVPSGDGGEPAVGLITGTNDEVRNRKGRYAAAGLAVSAAMAYPNRRM